MSKFPRADWLIAILLSINGTDKQMTSVVTRALSQGEVLIRANLAFFSATKAT